MNNIGFIGRQLDNSGPIELQAEATRKLALDALAAAQASAGDFDRAVATALRSIEIATATASSLEIEQARLRLDLYRRGQPYVEPTTAPTP